VLPLLEKNKEVMERNYKSTFSDEGEYLYRSKLSPMQVLENRMNEFFTTQRTFTWLSWNVADANIMKELSEEQQLSAVK
jgi:hypothetical protein